MRLEEYLSDPCRKLSIPYWKVQMTGVPENVRIVHHADYSDKLLEKYRDEPYFRLIHNLSEIKSFAVEGISFRTAKLSDILQIVEIINRSYENISVDETQILNYTKARVYDRELWILAVDERTHCAVGCGLADFDRQARESSLEWIQVVPEYRRRGIGRCIVNELLLRIKERADFATVSGKVNDPSAPERLYRRCGFVGDDVWHILTPRDY